MLEIGEVLCYTGEGRRQLPNLSEEDLQRFHAGSNALTKEMDRLFELQRDVIERLGELESEQGLSAEALEAERAKISAEIDVLCEQMIDLDKQRAKWREEWVCKRL